MPQTTGALRVQALEGGAVWRLVLGGRRGNVIDAALVASLLDALRAAAATPRLKALLLEGEGEHFSYGVSVEEHLPETAEAMLRGFHAVVRELAACPVVVLAAVRGRCLGGGLELALLCHRIVAAPGARLGQPEIALGVFAPVASLLLPERVGRARAEELCLSGREVGAEEALAMGLVDAVDDDPSEAALRWARERLLPRSASSLRYAARALRLGLLRRLHDDLASLERLYLDELMRTRDATEGVRAFLEKRPPEWRDS